MTKLLAIETTEKHGSIAFSENGANLAIMPLSSEQRSAQSLVPTIKNGLAEIGWTPQQLDVIAVAIGPGSFTGLRVGLATARMLAYAIDAKIIGVNTLQAIAANLVIGENVTSAALPTSTAPGQKIAVAVDAQRGEVCAQLFQWVPTNSILQITTQTSRQHALPVPVCEKQLLSFQQWWDWAKNEPNLLFTGPILEKIAFNKPENTVLAARECWFPNAVGVERMAWSNITTGTFDDLRTLQPFYSRLSAAEEKKQSMIRNTTHCQ